MTRRIALAILFSVWTMLLIGTVVAYFSVRSVMVADLDSLLYARAVALPELVHAQGFDPNRAPQYDWTDIYSIRPASDNVAPARPTITASRIQRGADGRHLRTLTIAAVSAASRSPVIVEYSGSMERIDKLLGRIAFALGAFTIIAGAIAAAVAVYVSRIVLRPLQSTASIIGKIDEQKLDARIPLPGLPTELLPVVQRLNELLDRLQRAFAGQKRFVANASHELRTPVAALATALELASRHPREAESYRQTIAQCLSQVQVLRVLVERVMEHVGNDVAGEDLQNVDVGTIIQQCLDAAEALGMSHNITVHAAGPRSLWCQVASNRLRSILMNLLGNAVEHNRAGGNVEVSWLHDGQQLRIRISDDGPGIPPEHLPHVFSPFYRGDKAHQQTQGHLGLGLFIVHSHVKAMGGVCRIESHVGQGTAFEVEIPCSKVPDDQIATTSRQKLIAR